MNQGDVYWYTFHEPDKRRPVLILTRDSAIGFLSSLTIAPITTTIRSIPSEVVLTEQDGMAQECAVNLDTIQTITKAKLHGYITHLSFARMAEVRDAISFALGFDFDSMGG
jgi:mRNA interferase MazF